MPVPRPLLLPLMLLVFAASVRGEADEGPGADDIPVVGRPVDLPFSEASGWFEVHARAEPTTLQAETALTFTVSVRAVRPARRPPQRLDLRQLPDFAERFYIEDAGEEVARPDDRTWEFAYRLKPRRTDVTAIPSLPFVYFNPYLLTATKGFQVLYTDPIPLHVLPHETVQVPVQAPESALALATGPEVLERQTPWTPPSIGTCVVLLLVPPLGCIAWYLLWRRLYPDAARLASQRRSRAAPRPASAARRAAARLPDPRRPHGGHRRRLSPAAAGPDGRRTDPARGCFVVCAAWLLVRADRAGRPLLRGMRQRAFSANVRIGVFPTARCRPSTHPRRGGGNVSYVPLLIALLLHAEPAPAPSDREILERAETEFQEGVRLRQARKQARPHFRNAAGYFDQLRQRGVRNAAMYRDLGNAYLLADDLPRALLSYHRGLRLSPNDRALRDSLAEARDSVVYPPSGDLGRPRRDDRPPWLPYLPSGWLMFAAIPCYVLGCVGVTRWRMVRRSGLLVGGLLTLLLAAVLAGWLMVRAEEQRERKAHPLVVIARDGVLLRRGNGEVFPTRYDTPVNRGVEGRLRFERGGWVQIELSGGEIGWVSREAVLIDRP